MNTAQITQLHERGTLILERIEEQKRAAAVHLENVALFEKFGTNTQRDNQAKKADRRNAAAVKLWKLYNETLNEIQNLTKYTNK